MSEAPPGQFWKTPFFWDPTCPPPAPARLAFRPVDEAWLPGALAQVMATSVDESDQHEVATLGADGAARALLDVMPSYFEREAGWWRSAHTAGGDAVGFVLPARFRAAKNWREGRPEGTVFYVGVLPAFRGQGHGAQLLAEATRVFIAANCWRGFCDTSSRNEPMKRAFRSAGYREQAPWLRPIA